MTSTMELNLLEGIQIKLECLAYIMGHSQKSGLTCWDLQGCKIFIKSLYGVRWSKTGKNRQGELDGYRKKLKDLR